MKAYGISCVGLVRKGNEDNFIALPQYGVAAVADGMGGHRAGEVASQIAVQVLEERAVELAHSSAQKAAEILVMGIHNANMQIMREGMSQAMREGMGTTLSALVVKEAQGIIGHVGDSRVYLWRNNILTQLTEDHSVVAELVRSGQLTELQAKDHPNRNMLSRALGMGMELDVDCFRIGLNVGDMFLLTTDGATNLLHEDEMAQVFAGAGEMFGEEDLGSSDEEAPEHPWQAYLKCLSHMILARGATDNYTMVCCSVEEEDLSVDPAEGSAEGVPEGPGERSGEGPVGGESTIQFGSTHEFNRNEPGQR
ncbi:MAG: protein phosphatase 2C domain-containing protein [Peptococcaceae bacterium]|nr:protein phosphatase 2C domain-containing protein [Peptococcaceae bacterium]